MKQMYNLMLVCLLIVSLSACGKQAGADFSADRVPEPRKSIFHKQKK